MFQGLGCSPIKAVRELRSERRETVRFISGVGVRALRGPFPSTRGPGRTHLWCTSYRAHGAMIYFTGEVSGSSPGWPSCTREKNRRRTDYFMHAPFGSGDIAQLVERRSCNWVVVITGWMPNCPGVGVGGSPRVPSSEIPGEEDQVGPCEQLDALSPFNLLSEMRQKKRKENPWTDPIISTP
ncbi:hypothetical protein ACH5RR_029510 [Cinchona calisaya]|uniref:Uncharacterized protein n=1 Tax=Cinchona calisaya TaxID=153742 RepID=A0ABD2YTF2_9GENT